MSHFGALAVLKQSKVAILRHVSQSKHCKSAVYYNQ